MKNRSYNILFHTHTISGIVISVVLYVIFFAGSFSFFRDEIINWERNHTVAFTEDMEMDFDATLDSLNTQYKLTGRDVELRKYYVEQRSSVSISVSKDSLNTIEAPSFFYLDTKDLSQHSYQNSYTLGEFLYRLHFLAQIYYPVGYYLAGFVALFFLFAIVTGVLVHWNKIVSNFYVFRPKSKLKALWTDAHTGLGMIGLPFQFVYAVTGAFFMIKALLILPNVMALYDGDQTKFYEDLGYSHPHFEFQNQPLENAFSVNELVQNTKNMWPDFNVGEIHIFNYGDSNMHVLLHGHLDYNTKFNAPGEAIYKVKTGELVSKTDPNQKTSYVESVKNILYRIHYGDYGGYALKIVSFVLGIISCFVIISGVMIWLVARNKKHIPERKRRFNEKLVNIYLAICLSMYPVTAAAFIAVKVFEPASQGFIYSFYFLSWLAATVFFIIKKNNYFTNKQSLLWGSILGFCIPLANGICTGNWFWTTFLNQQTQLFFIDVFWLILASLTLWVSIKIKKHAS